MHEAPAAILTTWSNFYVITGSSAGALTGLMFVVITLVAGGRSGPTKEGISTFSSPTVVHFCAALFVSAALNAPWRSLDAAAFVVALSGAWGICYVLRVAQKTRNQATYRPGFDDWLRYALVPLSAYIALFGAALGLAFVSVNALFVIAAAVVLLIFIGIHNAWDVVTYIAIERTSPAEIQPARKANDENAS